MPNGMDYSLKNRVIDGTGMILDTEPGTPDDVGTYVTENQLADWIKGKILFTGYYHNGNFYSDSGHTTLLAKVNGALYIDQTNANKALYVCLSSTYQSLTEEAQVQAIIDGLNDGTIVPLKARQDQNGNVIDQTYETKADASDLKSAISHIGSRIIDNQTISANTKLFSLGEAYPEDVVYFSYSYTGSGACFIELRDRKNSELAWYGKGSSSMEGTVFSGAFVIPANFSYAILRSNISGATADFSYINIEKDARNEKTRIVPTFNIMELLEAGTYSSKGEYAGGNSLRLPILELYKIGVNISLPQGIVMEVIELDSIGQSYTKYSGELTGDVSYQFSKKYQCVTFKKSGGTIQLSDLQNVSMSFVYFMSEISPSDIIEPSGDTSDRANDISSALNSSGVVTLGIGDYYISSKIIMPQGATLKGQGDGTRLIVSSSADIDAVLSLTTECTVEAIKIVGQTNSTPASLGTHNAISMLQVNSENRVLNVSIEGFDGSGIYALQTYSNAHNSNLITNCRFNLVGCGVYIGTRAEAFSVTNCTVLNSFIGIHCIGGNNRVMGCLIRGCTYGFDMTSSSTSDNDGHSTFIGLVIIHNTHAIKVSQIEYGALFNGCTVFYGDIVIENGAKGITFNGCEIGSVTAINGTGATGARILNSLFDDMMPSVVTNVALVNCIKMDGSIFGN